MERVRCIQLSFIHRRHFGTIAVLSRGWIPIDSDQQQGQQALGHHGSRFSASKQVGGEKK
jgi:hypothetical protein